MENKNLGMKIRVKLNKNLGAKDRKITYRNVTEIHYCYPSVTSELHGKKIAFESDIHGTGCTWHLADIDEFETELETKKARNF